MKDKSDNLKQHTQTPACGVANASTFNPESKILAELEKLWEENLEGHTQTKLLLTKLELSMQELKGEMTKLEKRTTEAEGCISAMEDNEKKYERAIR